MNPGAKVVVMIPTLNEERCIGDVIDGIPTMDLRAMGFEVETIVVDGHSCDRTVEIAKQKGAKVYTQNGNGKGSGLRQIFMLRNPQEVVIRTLSLKSAIDSDLGALSVLLDSKYVVMLDGDGTYPSSYISDLVEALEEGYDVVLGSRFKGRIENGSMSRLNIFGNRMLSNLATMLYVKPVSDLCTGMWGFNTEALRNMKLDSTHFDIEAEMFAELAKNMMKIGEVPIEYLKREGESKLIPMEAGFMILKKLIQRRFATAERIAVKATAEKESSHTTSLAQQWVEGYE
ncbi:MAG: glycosyltransferase [Methanomassiliicoccales archaeon]|nr:glycosyltransferase [Methanomassiliicoccales archaeon]